MLGSGFGEPVYSGQSASAVRNVIVDKPFLVRFGFSVTGAAMEADLPLTSRLSSTTKPRVRLGLGVRVDEKGSILRV